MTITVNGDKLENLRQQLLGSIEKDVNEIKEIFEQLSQIEELLKDENLSADTKVKIQASSIEVRKRTMNLVDGARDKLSVLQGFSNIMSG